MRGRSGVSFPQHVPGGLGMRIFRAGLVGLASAVVLLGATGAMAAISISLDRRFPTAYCPIDNDSFDLTFTAETDRVKIRVQGNNFSGATWLAQRLDNMVVVPKSVFDAHRLITPGFSACFLAPGPANYKGYDFSAAGTTENFFDQFDANAAAWDLTNYGWWDNVTFNASAPRNSTTGADRTGGALALGRQTDGTVTVSTDFTVTGLTPGTLYVLTGWWSTEALNTLTVTLDTNPCKDLDGDGVTDCAGDCNDQDAKIRTGAVEVCDGRDNDCNGSIDDAVACVRTCTTPSKLGTDVRVTTAEFDSSAPSIAWNGIDYGMLWKDSRNGNQEIFFTHMTPSGTKVGGDISVTGPCGDCVNPRVVWSGTEYGAVWSQNGEITFRRLDRAGAPIGTAVPLIDPAGSGADEPDIAWTGSEYGVVWDQFVGPQQIRFVRLDRQGNKLSQILHITDDTSFFGNARPRVAWGGTNYGITWQGNAGSQPEIFFERVGQRQGPFPALQITTHNLVALHPQIVWNGTEWGIAWQDHRTFTEIYFQRVSAAGAKVGAELRVTNAAGASQEPSLAWTGSEYGVVWDDDRSGNLELWFARISSAGAKVGSDLQLTNATGQSDLPTLAWGGSKFAVAWHDDRFAGESEILFLRLGCNCVDADVDGASSCVECDDTRAAVYGGAPQLCDGLNNDCDSTSWPLLTGTNEADVDGDSFSTCGGDCNDANGTIWATPGEVRSLVISHNQVTSTSTLSWTAPSLPGATSDLYDTLRSTTPSNFTSSATCVETNDGSNTSATDAMALPPLGAFFYLVRAENSCPSGQGVLGKNTAGTPTPGRTCP
jgi:hypothetical protein